jgi:hypothetical protein
MPVKTSIVSVRSAMVVNKIDNSKNFGAFMPVNTNKPFNMSKKKEKFVRKEALIRKKIVILHTNYYYTCT